MKKKILLLDTSFSAKPIYDFLCSTGAEVYVMGGKPEDALAKSVKNFICLDYSEIDKVKNILVKMGIDYLVPGGNDFSYKICSEINSEIPFYNIDPISSYQIINNKEEFRKFAKFINLKVPKLFGPDSIDNKIPLIVKPTDAYSGHGITIVEAGNALKLKKAIETAKKQSKSGCFLIEEFVKGQLYSHSAFIINGRIAIDFIVEEHCIVNQYAVDTSFVINDFDPSVLNQIRSEIEKLNHELHLCDGLIHTQFIFNGTDYWLIEITRRCPGDLYSKLIEYSTGLPYAEYYARPFISGTKEVPNIKPQHKMVIRHTLTQAHKSSFHSITYNHPISQLNMVPLSLTGDCIYESPYSRIGIIFAFAKNKNDFYEILNKTLNRNLYSIQ